MGEPDAPARPIPALAAKRYRHMIYGFAKAAAIIEEGVKDKPAPRPSRRRDGDTAKPREHVTPAGLVLPGGAPT